MQRRSSAASGYVLYGAATALVYTGGAGVDGFVLDPGIGEILLSHPGIRCPHTGSCYNIKRGNARFAGAASARAARL